MLFLAHCSLQDAGSPGLGFFSYLVDAPDLAAAKDRLREQVARAREESDLFDEPTEISLDDVIEVGELPRDGLIGRYQKFVKYPGAYIALSLPNCNSASCVAYESGDDTGKGDEGGGVEPFIVLGTKGRRRGGKQK